GYAGGLVAINDGVIDRSYSGQYYRSQNNSNRTVVYATGDNSYAGGFVAINGGTITNSYATNRATANLYVGGFVGLNSGSIESAYAVGGTGRGGNSNGAFAGSNDVGTITKAAAYAAPADFWLREEDYFELINNEDKLGDMAGVLYPNADRFMTSTDKEGYRYPILTNRI
ncbi:MAG: hypothetical protein K2K24_00300, partial [Clostridia bacterium]|nr:hypothetical protein [Clostridia bacterium]